LLLEACRLSAWGGETFPPEGKGRVFESRRADLFKVLSVVSMIGIPPTLIAGIYGMNFKSMPELNWDGVPFRPRRRRT